MNKDIVRAVGFGKLVDAVERGECPFCGKPIVDNFRDELSRKEFKISGLCQSCQDEMFGGSNEF